MSLDLGAPIRTALLADAGITALLSTLRGSPAIFTRRPTPSDAVRPLIVVSEDISITDADALRSDRPIVIRDILVYGDQPDQFRAVETLGYLIRDLFHRQKGSVVSSTYDIIDIQASGPRAAPTSDEEVVGRVVSLTFMMRKKP
jgi:hypothetical protein